MRIGVMGAGAVGCYFGALLARAGHDVTLVGRQSFVDGVRASGLRLEMAGETIRPDVRASTDPADLAGCELLIFSVKSTDTESAGREMAPHVAPATPVLSFQNGLDNAERLARVLDRPVIPVSVYVAAELLGPGHVRHNGRGDIVMGASEPSDRIAVVFRDALIPATVSNDVRKSLWMKLTVNCVYNALSAITQMPYGKITAEDGVEDLMRDVIHECDAVGTAEGLRLSEQDVEGILGLARTMPGQYSSMAQDLSRGNRTEIDHMNGYIVRKGRELGLATPVNRTLALVVKLLEAKRRPERPS